MSASVVLALIAWVNGLQPNLAAGLFAIAAMPSLAMFLVLPAINADWGAALVLVAWLASVTVLVSVTGGAASLLAAGFVAVLAQSLAIKRVWIAETGAAAVLAYAAAAAIGADRGAPSGDLGAWPQMMVVAYLAYSAGLLASAPTGVSRARIEQRLAEVAHELRTPLTHILGFSEMIERQVFGPLKEKYVEYASLIRTSGAHLLDLSNDLLDLSRIDAGSYPLTIERFDARDVVNEVVGSSALSAQAKAIALSAVLPSGALSVRADRRAMLRILLNAVGNAIKFTPENGRVEVKAFAEDGALVLETIDSGPGISAAEKLRLGQAYVRGESGLGIEGAGLGLSLVRALAALHGGRLGFDDAPGGGAIVRVTLPVLATQ
ncbi:MAG: HAMP domain-containing histidine kinase [Proteobacteria bacterium]|nr:HAMP domain-containing histidine kinase [Pseudomonadota bacterium]